jgi:hypothetical protein
MTLEHSNKLNVKFSLVNEEKRIVYGVVYTPNMLDSLKGFTDKEEIEKLAYRFMSLDLTKVIDTQHDNIPNGCYPVESFIARDKDENFPEGSWVLAVKVTDEDIWNNILQGKFNGYSMEILTKVKPYTIKYSNFNNYVGKTEDNKTHSHYYYLEFDSQGRILRGRTSEDDGHFHEVKTNSTTQVANNHSHRIVITN